MNDTKKSDGSPFRVLGIAMVIEERGKRARLVFRYPTHASDIENADNLFFTLPPRVLSKLFRPKKSLCGQPMTISVGGTVFCCRAVIMQPDGTFISSSSSAAAEAAEAASLEAAEASATTTTTKITTTTTEQTTEQTTTNSNSNNNNITNNNHNTSDLVMFSIFVASIPSVGTSLIPISGWFQGEQQQVYPSITRGVKHNLPSQEYQSAAIASDSFKFIQQIHVSLARISRAMEREEMRCRFVSMQTSQLRKIEAAYKPAKQGKNSNLRNTNTTSTADKQRFRKSLSSGPISNNDSTSVLSQIERESNQTDERRRREKEILDLMFSAKFEGSNIYGNIVRELVEVFYSLSQNATSGAPSSLLSARDGTVYINSHVAVPIETPYQPPIKAGDMPLVRPYHTLLFPNASKEQLARSLAPTSSHMRLFFQLIDPRKTLSDISTESGVPIQNLIDMATQLVSNRVARLSHVLHKQSMLSCTRDAVSRMADKAIYFAQNFDHLSIFAIVSSLTRGQNLGDVIKDLISTTNSSVLNVYGERIKSFVEDIQEYRRKIRTSALESDRTMGGIENEDEKHQEEDLESSLDNYIFRLVAWLRAQNILIAKEEYWIAGNFITGRGQRKSTSTGAAVVDRARDFNASSFPEESVLSLSWASDNNNLSGSERQMREEQVFQRVEASLNGRTSGVALMWKYGLDATKLNRLRKWGLQNGKIWTLMRLPVSGDDWGAVYN